MKIAMLYQNRPAFLLNAHEQIGLGGSENGFLATIRYLTLYGHDVHVFNLADVHNMKPYANLTWSNLKYFDPREPFDVVYSLRHREPFQKPMNAKLKVLFLADTESRGLGKDVLEGKIDLVMAVSNWQKDKIAREEGIPSSHWMVTSNGVDGAMPDLFAMWNTMNAGQRKIPAHAIYMGTPERGLSTLLDVWPYIRERVPQATLELFSSFIAWDETPENNAIMLRDVYAKAENMRDMGVVNRIHGASTEIRNALMRSSVYLYPTDFSETCCMSILEAMFCGVIPVATSKAALTEKVVAGVTGFPIPDYGTSNPRYAKEFVDAAVAALTLTPNELMRYGANGQAYASQFTYDKLVPAWLAEWQSRLR